MLASGPDPRLTEGQLPAVLPLSPAAGAELAELELSVAGVEPDDEVDPVFVPDEPRESVL